MDDSTFASRKSSLRALILYINIYIHFTISPFWFSPLDMLIVPLGCTAGNEFYLAFLPLMKKNKFIQVCYYGAFPLHGTARYGSVRLTFEGFSTGYSTWYLVLFLVPPRPRFQVNCTVIKNVMFKLCWSLIGRRKSSLPASLNLRHETQQTR